MKSDFEIFKKYLETLKEQSDKYNEMAKYIGLTPESDISNPIYTLIDSYVDVLKHLYEDNLEWIDYFIWECDWGKRPGEVSINGEELILDSYDKLFCLINKSKFVD